MNEDRLRQLLQQADRSAGPPRPMAVDVKTIQRRAGTRRLTWRIGCGALAAAAAVGLCVWLGQLPPGTPAPATDAQRIAQLEAEVRQLRASTDRTLALLQELAQERERDRRIAELKKELASIPDPMDQVRQQVGQAAERMVQEGDRIWQERRQRATAIARYKRVIELFPDNEWAAVARQRLSRITGTQLEGESI